MRWIVVAFALLFSTAAQAQCSGTIPNGYICGNLSGQQGVFAAYPFANFSCIFGCNFGNGLANGARFNSSLGSADAALYETPGNQFAAQIGLAGTFLITDQNANALFSIEGPIPQAQGGTTNGNNYELQSNICSEGDENYTVSGTATAGESPGFTYKVGSTTVTITYTVQAGDTNSSIVAGLALAVKNSVAMAGIINGNCPNGNYFNGTKTSIQYASGVEGGFDIIWTADPNAAGNAWTAINTTHTTITVTPVSIFIGQTGIIVSSFIPGRDAVAGDNIFVGSFLFQNNLGVATTYLTDQLTVVNPTTAAFSRTWTGGNGCGFNWATTTGIVSFSAVNCDLDIIANSSSTNNIFLTTGNAGAIELQPGSGGVTSTVPFAVAYGGTGASTAGAARTNLGVAPGTGLATTGSVLNSRAETIDTYSTGPINSVLTAKVGYTVWNVSSTVDNLATDTLQYTCSGAPTITYYECGTSVTCASPTQIGAITLAASGRVYYNTTGLSATSISAGDFTAWGLSGTCSALQLTAKAQVHAQ
jgi:hypothetical protein